MLLLLLAAAADILAVSRGLLKRGNWLHIEVSDEFDSNECAVVGVEQGVVVEPPPAPLWCC